MKNQEYSLKQVVDILLSDNGCSWDRSQNLDSLKQYLLEETYELLESMDNPEKHKEELGDLFFQIMFQSALREKENLFSFDDVEQYVAKKLIDRHPHIFQRSELPTTDDSLQINEKKWEQQKRKAKKLKSFMDDIPSFYPALLESDKIQRRATAAGFDWKTLDGPKQKIYEELEELNEALENNDKSHIQEEFGDLLFAIVNFGRHLGINSEVTLLKTNQKFKTRFRKMEELASEKGVKLEKLTLEEQDQLWVKAKNLLKTQHHKI